MRRRSALPALAYLFARRQAGNARFTFGTGKFGDLAAFSSAIILAMIAVQIAYESVLRLFTPVPIAYGEAIAVAALGLCRQSRSVRGCCATAMTTIMATHGIMIMTRTIMSSPPPSRQQSSRGLCPCAGGRRDLGACDRGAGASRWYSDWVWADPAVGIVGSLVIASWAFGLIRASGAVLLDVSADKKLERTDPRADREPATIASPICISGRSVPAIVPP